MLDIAKYSHFYMQYFLNVMILALYKNIIVFHLV